ncbi:hypothetical protein HY635_03425 [Candidatus Uhrbacteria bacterium]|nr:hypothetical protein [Candidatus Uhrbacteria bacterium]
MTRREAKAKFATALYAVTANRAGGLRQFSGLAPDIESWPLTRLGGEQPLTAFEWFEVYRVCFREATTGPITSALEGHHRGAETTVGDLLAAMQQAHA